MFILTIIAFTFKEPVRHKLIVKKGHVQELLSIVRFALVDNKMLKWFIWYIAVIYAFYQSALKRIIALKCAEHSSRYALQSGNGVMTEDRARNLKEVEKLQQEQVEIRNKLKNEKNMGTKVQLNTQMKMVNDRIEAIKREL